MGLGLPLGPASQGPAPGPPQNGTEPEACAPAHVSLEGSAESGPDLPCRPRGGSKEAAWNSQPRAWSQKANRGTIHILTCTQEVWRTSVPFPWGLSPVSKGCEKPGHCIFDKSAGEKQRRPQNGENPFLLKRQAVSPWPSLSLSAAGDPPPLSLCLRRKMMDRVGGRK